MEAHHERNDPEPRQNKSTERDTETIPTTELVDKGMKRADRNVLYVFKRWKKIQLFFVKM